MIRAWGPPIGAAILIFGALLADAEAAPKDDDLWGPGNELSNVRGGQPQSDPRHAPVRLGDGPGVRALCDAHFRDMKRTDESERRRIETSRATARQKEDAYRAYTESRDQQSRSCVASFPGAYEHLAQAHAEAQVRGPFPVHETGSCDHPIEIDWRAQVLLARLTERALELFVSRLAAGRWEPGVSMPGPAMTEEMVLRNLILSHVPPGKIFRFKGEGPMYQLFRSGETFMLMRPACA
ncbi:MAG: hypothetical protein HYU41_23295 [Candidatus Rokubacteria bacterium]|nr:hypothetical protein [Candidatus Rokubacteria bacterium]